MLNVWLNDSGTKEQLKKRLIQYYQAKFMAEVETKEFWPMSQAENTEERISNVKNSVRELKFSIQSELAVVRQSMEAVMTQLQAPTSSTPLPPKVNFVEESSTQEELASHDNVTQEDRILLSKMNRKKRFLTSSAERVMRELERLIEENADVTMVERKLTKLNAVESECIKAIDEIVTQVDNDDLAENEMQKTKLNYTLLEIHGS